MVHLMKYFLTPALLLIIQFVYGQRTILSIEPALREINQDGFALSWTFSDSLPAIVEWGKDTECRDGQIFMEHATSHFWRFNKGLPGEIYYVRLGMVKLGDTIRGNPYAYATKSLSSGDIKVFFNHPVQPEDSVSGMNHASFLDGCMDDSLFAYLNRAKETIDIAVYNMASDGLDSPLSTILNNASKRGVQVRIIYNQSSANTLLPMLSPQIGRLASRSGPEFGIMHNKFLVIDADAENPNQPIVWTGSVNWTSDQLNGPDLNNVLVIQDQSLARAYKIEFEEMYGGSGPFPDKTKSRTGPEKMDNTPHHFLIGGRKVRSYFSPSDKVNQQIIDVIGSTQFDIEFASMLITRFDILNAIEAKAQKQGYEIFGITHDSAASDPAPYIWFKMRQILTSDHMKSHNGLKGIMHHKFLVVDATKSSSDPQVLTGSHNWTNSADQRNDENTLIIHDFEIARDYYLAFKRIFSKYSETIQGLQGKDYKPCISVTPNPVGDLSHIRLLHESKPFKKIIICDMRGRIVKEVEGFTDSIEWVDVKPGIYLLGFIWENQTVYLKIIHE